MLLMDLKIVLYYLIISILILGILRRLKPPPLRGGYMFALQAKEPLDPALRPTLKYLASQINK